MIPANLQICSSDPSVPLAINCKFGTTNWVVEVCKTSLSLSSIIIISMKSGKEERKDALEISNQ